MEVRFYRFDRLSFLGIIVLLTLVFTLGYAQESTSEAAAETSETMETVEAMEEMIATHTIGEGSQASFSIFEVLLGNDKTVIGTTSLVTGDLSFDLENPQAAQIGLISIDARDLTTDDSRRNGAIQRRVLNTSQAGNEFITFEATSIEGLPESVAVGDSFELQVTGNLTIVGTTLEEVFTVNVTVNSETELQGVGTATIMYKDYGISIPQVRIVASVADELPLEIAFVAGALEE